MSNEQIPKYRLGKRNKRAIIEVETGHEYLVFHGGKTEHIEEFKNFLNNKALSQPKDIERLEAEFNKWLKLETNIDMENHIRLFNWFLPYLYPKEQPKESDAIVFYNVIQERITHFKNVNHKYEAQILTESLKQIKDLINPDNFKTKQ